MNKNMIKNIACINGELIYGTHDKIEQTRRNDKHLINLSVRKPITFRKINLMDDNEVANITGCDFIFCRNCLIYFDDESRKKVLSNFYNSLNPGGFIFLGHSESVGRISSAYKVQRIGDTIVYSKPR